MRIAQEEIFGPVLSVIPYDDDADAVRIANDSDYGLCGAVFSGDNDRGLDVARQVRTGTYMVNSSIPIDFSSPFGGYKASGVGREFGEDGLELFLEKKTINLPPGTARRCDRAGPGGRPICSTSDRWASGRWRSSRQWMPSDLRKWRARLVAGRRWCNRRHLTR